MEIKQLNYISLHELFDLASLDEDEQDLVEENLQDDFSYGDDGWTFIRVEWLYDYDSTGKIKNIELPSNLFIKL